MESSTPPGEPTPRKSTAKKSAAKKSPSKKSVAKKSTSRTTPARSSSTTKPTKAAKTSKRATPAKKSSPAKRAQPAEPLESSQPTVVEVPPEQVSDQPEPTESVAAPVGSGPGENVPVTNAFHEPVVLDLGRTVFPIIVKRLAPLVLAGAGLFAFLRLLRRRLSR